MSERADRIGAADSPGYCCLPCNNGRCPANVSGLSTPCMGAVTVSGKRYNCSCRCAQTANR